MPRRPIEPPLFATDAGVGQIVEPVEVVRQQGFASGDRPPAQWFNWMFHHTGEWINFLRGPSSSRWEVADTGTTASVTAMAADTDTAETAVSVRRLLGKFADTSNFRYSVRGQEWTILALDPTEVTFGIPVAIFWTGTRWVVSATAGGPVGKVWYTAGHTVAGSALGGSPWTSATVAGSPTSVTSFAVGESGVVVALGTTAVTKKIWYSLDDGATFALATLSAATASAFKDVLWDGTAWVAITALGEVYRTTTATGTWTLLGATLGSQTSWSLATDTNEIVAVPVGNAADVDWYVSDDHGLTWDAMVAPADLVYLTAIERIDDVWFVTSDGAAPFLAASNTLPAAGWVRLKLPWYDSDTDMGRRGILLSEGALVTWGFGVTLLSARGKSVV